MDDKKAADVLINFLKNRSLGNEEKEAIKAAIGVLSWTSLSKSSVKALKKKQGKYIKWQSSGRSA